jgi:hypothetical protein
VSLRFSAAAAMRALLELAHTLHSYFDLKKSARGGRTDGGR